MKRIIDKPHGWFRDWFRKVWKVRGGGLYACGFAATFITLEFGSLQEDLAQIGSLVNGQIFEFVIQIIIDSFINTFKALIWPVYVLKLAPPWGAIGLGLAFIGFTKYLKPPISRWLFPDGSAEDSQEQQESG